MLHARIYWQKSNYLGTGHTVSIAMQKEHVYQKIKGYTSPSELNSSSSRFFIRRKQVIVENWLRDNIKQCWKKNRCRYFQNRILRKYYKKKPLGRKYGKKLWEMFYCYSNWSCLRNSSLVVKRMNHLPT